MTGERYHVKFIKNCQKWSEKFKNIFHSEHFLFYLTPRFDRFFLLLTYLEHTSSPLQDEELRELLGVCTTLCSTLENLPCSKKA